MKARILRDNRSLLLLLCTGVIKTITLSEAKDFILSFDDPVHYEGPGSWDYDDISMETYRGDTIVSVSDDGVLSVYDPGTFRDIIAFKAPRLLTVPEYAALHEKKTAIVRRYCLEGRISGAIQKGTRWLIPEDAPYPVEE